VDVDGMIGKRGEHVPVNVTAFVAVQGKFGYTQTKLAVYLSLARVPPVTWGVINQDDFTNTSITKADISLLHQVSEHKNTMTSLDGRACASFGQDKQYCMICVPY
jgi:hypothetical protein